MIKTLEIGNKVCLIADQHKEIYTVTEKLEISTGPMRQHEPCQIWGVIDMRGRRWQFREDALMLKEDFRLTNKYIDGLEDAITDIREEVYRAKSMFPTNFHNQHEGYAVILEEFDELWNEVKKNQKVYDLPAQRKEAIQTAAMLLRFIVELVEK